MHLDPIGAAIRSIHGIPGWWIKRSGRAATFALLSGSGDCSCAQHPRFLRIQSGNRYFGEYMTASTMPLTASTNEASIAAAAGRVMIAAIFLLSGFGKLADPAGTIGYISSAGLPLPAIAYATAVAVELVGGTLLVMGFRTRLAAWALTVFTLAAAFGFHLQFADQNQFLHFFKNLAMAGGLLQVAAFGPGRLSIDTRRARVTGRESRFDASPGKRVGAGQAAQGAASRSELP